MKRPNRILLMMATVLLCTVCFAIGLTACGRDKQEPHKHTYSESWTTDETYHWHAPTCGDTTVPKDKAEHSFGTDNKCTDCQYEKVDEHRYSDWLSNDETHYKLDLCHNNVKVFEAEHDFGEGKTTCTICGYTIAAHKHTYGDWTWDTENHWQPATCGDTDEPFGFGAHVDENGDEVCDICPFKYEHIHEEAENWTFDETRHWKTPPCHADAVLEESTHDFVDGLCECGIKEIEVKVYAIYVEHEGNKADSFVDWLNALTNAGVIEMRITESGDVVYEYENGITEIKYLAERTIKVKAITVDGTGLPHVWLKVMLYENNEYYENGGTTALGLAETDGDGIAEIVFLPLGGYSSAKVEYRVRVAEAKDLSILQGIDEGSAKPLPARYFIADENGDGVIVIEIGENTSVEDIAGQFTFAFSNGWGATEKFTLPYHRYYTNPLEIEKAELIDENKTYDFTASGNGLFDYFYFIPYFIPVGYELFNYPPAKAEIIKNNLYNAASGVYKISFKVVEGTADIRLYSWNENRISFDGVYDTKADGTPADKYINSVSGVSPSGTDERYTGEDFVYLTIAPEHAVFNFQFGLISDAECKVTITVERIDDYRVSLTPDFVFEVDSEGNGKISNAVFSTLNTDRYKNNNMVLLGIGAMSAGTYVLQIAPPNPTITITAGLFYARLADGSEYLLWEGSTGQGKAQSKSYKNIITISDEDSLLYIVDYGMSSYQWTITLEKYEPTTVTSGAWMYVPSTPVSFGETYQIPLNLTPGTYTIDIRTFGANHGGEDYPFTINIGSKVFTINGKKATDANRFDYTGTITVDAGDNMISLNCSTKMAVIARVMLTAIA